MPLNAKEMVDTSLLQEAEKKKEKYAMLCMRVEWC